MPTQIEIRAPAEISKTRHDELSLRSGIQCGCRLQGSSFRLGCFMLVGLLFLSSSSSKHDDISGMDYVGGKCRDLCPSGALSPKCQPHTLSSGFHLSACTGTNYKLFLHRMQAGAHECQRLVALLDMRALLGGSRGLITPISHMVTPIIRLLTYLLSPPDPPSRGQKEYSAL